MCPSLLWMVCASVTMNVAAGINLYHEAFCQFFFFPHVEFINYGSSNFHKRVIWIHVWFVSALFLIWPVIHFNCGVVSESMWVLQIRFCFLKHWRKEINQPYVMQQMFPGQKASHIARSEFCFVWNKHLILHSPHVLTACCLLSGHFPDSFCACLPTYGFV